MHASRHPLAGQYVTVKSGPYAGQTYHVEDWLDRVFGMSWMDAGGNPTALKYALSGQPMNDEVVYGKIAGMGCAINVTYL